MLDKMVIGLVGGTAVAVVGVVSMIGSRPAAATTKYAAETGKPCAQCHQHPTGGPELTPFGEKFKANGYKLPKEPLK